MNVFGHDHVAQHDESIALPDLLQDFEKQTATRGGAKQRLSAITPEGDEMEIVVSVVTLEAPRHGSRLGDYGAEFCDAFSLER